MSTDSSDELTRLASSSETGEWGAPQPYLELLQDSSNPAYELISLDLGPVSSLAPSPDFQSATCTDCLAGATPHTMPPPPSQWYCNENHHDGLLSTLAESKNSCRICAIIIKQVRSDSSEYSDKHRYYKLITRANKPHCFSVWVTNAPDGDNTSTNDNILGEFGLYYSRAPRHSPVEEQGIVYTPLPFNGRVSFAPHLVPINFPCNEKALEKIKYWINTCSQNHDICRKTRQPAYLPKRVVKIVSDNQVSLYFPGKEEVAPFVTLSYRWGDGLPLCTTLETLERLKAGISLSELPDTLRDAVLICRGLGFDFVWIDALCIIQDDENDWAEQSAEMTNIYRRGSLNLCAADAKNCGSGMQEKVAPHLLKIATESTPTTTIPTNMEETVVLVASPSKPVIVTFDTCGLDSRGWVFQERLSSVCSLYVGRRHGLAWDCCTMVDTIDSNEPILTSASDDAFEPLTLKRSWAETMCLADEEPRFKHSRHPRISLHRKYSNVWYNWIERYTSRKLSVESDRLPAVAGLASSVASKSGMTYAAGLWENDILPGLTWAVVGSVERIPSSAPSWSWASVYGGVYYSQFFSMAVSNRGILEENSELDLKILHINVDEMSPGKFGEVRRGEIKAVGVMKHALTMLRHERWTAECYLDFKGVSENNHSLYKRYKFLRLVGVYREKNYGGGPISYFLIIEETGEKQDEFRRVGVGSVDMHWPGLAGRFTSRDDLKPREEEIWAGAETINLSLV